MKWVKTKEELPEIPYTVIISDGKEWTTGRWYSEQEGGLGWRQDWGRDNIKTVDYWMLPIPPNEK